MNDQPRDNPSRYKRFVYEFEVEVTDEFAVQMAADSPDYDMDAPAEFDPQVEQIVLERLDRAMDDIGHGIRRKDHGSLRSRTVNEDGNYEPEPLLAWSGRNDDGSFKETVEESMKRSRPLAQTDTDQTPDDRP